jgi:ABC-type multidrug transport system ATPase subunit
MNKVAIEQQILNIVKGINFDYPELGAGKRATLKALVHELEAIEGEIRLLETLEFESI